MKAFAATHRGLEKVLCRELLDMGINAPEPETGGVGFDADDRQLYRANLGLRTASRVVVRVATFRARTFPELERHAKKIGWEELVSPGLAAHFRVTSKKSKLYHEDGIAERFATAVLGRTSGVSIVASREETDAGERDVTASPVSQRFMVRFHRDVCTVSVDSSGPLLHRRGYRIDAGKAPIRETLAAGLLLASGWTGKAPLADPFCGSGTIPIEAAMMARRIAPGLGRRFGFEVWPRFDRAAYSAVTSELKAQAIPPNGHPILGADRDAGAIEAAAANAGRAQVAADIEWRCDPLSALVPPAIPGWLVTNPPYGGRLGDRSDLRDLYAQLGHVLRRTCPRWQVAMISADRKLAQQVGLEWRELLATENGGLPIRFVTAEVPAR